MDHFDKGHKYCRFEPEAIDDLVAKLIKLPEVLEIADPWFQLKLGTLHTNEENYELAEKCYQNAKKLFESSENPPAGVNDILISLDKMIERVRDSQEPKNSSCILS